MNATILGKEGKSRCHWCGEDADYIAYHDNEWGFPSSDDFQLFEKLCLESFQSGLSWKTILNKRDNFRKAFNHFDFNQIALFNQNDIDRLLDDAGIVRHKGKIEATLNNAKIAQHIVSQYGSLATFIWRYEETSSQEPQTMTTSPKSIALAKDLKKLGWKFFGPTTAYAFIQSMGLCNDHALDCIIRKQVDQALTTFKRP